MPSKDKTSTEKFWTEAQAALDSLQTCKLPYLMCNLCIFVKYLFVNNFHTILNISRMPQPDQEELRGRSLHTRHW